MRTRETFCRLRTCARSFEIVAGVKGRPREYCCEEHWAEARRIRRRTYSARLLASRRRAEKKKLTAVGPQE